MSCEPPEGWRCAELGDLVKVHHGFAFRGEFFRDEPRGDILLTPGNFAIGGGFTWNKRKYYDGPVDDRFVLRAGDLLISMTDLSRNSDALGAPALVPAAPDGVRMLHNQRLGRVEVLHPDLLDRRYLYAALRSSAYHRQIVASATGTTVRHTSPAKIGAAVIPLPPIREQVGIASVLGAFDDKIDSNRRIARLLDEVGGLLHKRWVSTRQDVDTVPVGSRVEVLLGGTPSRNEPAYWEDGTIPWIASAKANEFRILEPTEWITERGLAESATKLLPAGTTVVAITGATMGKVSRLEIDACANQSIVGLVGNDETPDAFLFYWLRSVIPELLSKQTGAAQQHVNKGDIESLPIPCTGAPEVAELCSQIDPLLAGTGTLLQEGSVLARVRDLLLPKLVSGEIRVLDSADPVEPIEPLVEEEAA